MTAVCAAVLGPEYKIVEIGFDVPGPGAVDQPWHRDFKAPAATLTGRRINSLAFNLTAVDTRADHGPLEIAPVALPPLEGRCVQHRRTGPASGEPGS